LALLLILSVKPEIKRNQTQNAMLATRIIIISKINLLPSNLLDCLESSSRRTEVIPQIWCKKTINDCSAKN